MRNKIGVLGLFLFSLVCAIFLIAAYTNYRGGVNADDPYQVAGVDIIKSLTFYADSLGGASLTAAAFTPQRAITFKTGSISTTSVFVADTGTAAARGQVTIGSGATTFSIFMDSNMVYTSTDPADVTFPAGVPCTLFVYDDVPGGTDFNGAGGFDVNAVFWYTDD